MNRTILLAISLIALLSLSLRGQESGDSAARNLQLSAASYRGAKIYYGARTQDLDYLILVGKDVASPPGVRQQDGVTYVDLPDLGEIQPGGIAGKTELFVLTSQGLRRGEMSPLSEEVVKDWLGTLDGTSLLGQLVDHLAVQETAFELSLRLQPAKANDAGPKALAKADEEVVGGTISGGKKMISYGKRGDQVAYVVIQEMGEKYVRLGSNVDHENKIISREDEVIRLGNLDLSPDKVVLYLSNEDGIRSGSLSPIPFETFDEGLSACSDAPHLLGPLIQWLLDGGHEIELKLAPWQGSGEAGAGVLR